jgi:drug/metabolite transporter (DMT)-like permease
MGPDAVRGIDVQGLGQVAVLGAALSYALAGLYGRRFREMPSSVAAAGMLTATTLVMVPVVLVFEPPSGAWPGATIWGAMLGLAVLSTALAYLIYFRLLATAGATNLLLVTFLIPVSALALGIGVLGEQPTWTAFAGMGLVFLGLAAVDGRLFRRGSKVATPLRP